jgi:protein-disulfide isomerase
MIRRMLKTLFVVGSLGALLLGCQKGDPSTSEKLDRLEAKLDTISRKVETMGSGRAQPQRPERPRGADPSTVYSVPIGDAPVKGPATAKVTIVEAAEFA